MVIGSRGAKVGGVGGVATPPEFWKGGGVEPPPLIFRKICVEILKRGLLPKFLKSRPFLIALRRIAKKWSFLMRKNS